MDSNHSETTNIVTYKSTKSLKRCLTYWQVFSMVVGSILGPDLFISPSLVAALAPNMFIAIIVWILAGGCALFGSLCYCELGSVVKKTGSSYIFIYIYQLGFRNGDSCISQLLAITHDIYSNFDPLHD